MSLDAGQFGQSGNAVRTACLALTQQVAAPGWLGPVGTAVPAVPFLAALTLIIGRENVPGDNWRNLKVLILVGVLLIAQIIFLWEMS